MKGYQNNLTRIKAVANALQDLKPEVAFVGGATVSLYLEPFAHDQARYTDDVDVVIEVISRVEMGKLEEKLRNRGFQPDVESKVICRHRIQGIIVDIMPTDPSILGFANKWYNLGMAHTIERTIDSVQIRLFPMVIFLATKMAAFADRGKDDYRASKDIQDIALVLAYGSDWAQLSDYAQLNTELNSFLSQAANQMLDRRNIEEDIAIHLDYYSGMAQAATAIQRLVQLKKLVDI